MEVETNSRARAPAVKGENGRGHDECVLAKGEQNLFDCDFGSGLITWNLPYDRPALQAHTTVGRIACRGYLF